jgi:hypothetical protein
VQTQLTEHGSVPVERGVVFLQRHGQAMKLGWQPRKWLKKKAKAGFRSFPVGTVAFYGPDDRRASKVAVGIFSKSDSEPAALRRWISESHDIRNDEAILAQVVTFLREHHVHSVSMVDRIIGCPHEEGIDYPNGEACPHCPFWKGRDRWAGPSRI